MKLYLRRTLVLPEDRQQGKEAIGKEFIIAHRTLFKKVPIVQECDATTDAMKTFGMSPK